MADSTAFARAEELVFYATIPLALNALVKLGVLELIADSALSAAEILSRITNSPNSNAEFLERTLRLLARYGVVSETSAQGQLKYKLSEIGKPYAKGGPLAPALSVFCNLEIFLKPFEHIHEAILEGGDPFRRAHGDKTAFELSAQQPELTTNFSLLMAGHSKRSSFVVLDGYKEFSNIHTLVDVGGSRGMLLSEIISRYPHIKGINLDLPHVVANGIPCKGIEHVGGDMFESIPQGDAILLKWILHNWTDEQCVKILQNCYKSLPAAGKVIAVESLLPSEAYQIASEIELRIVLLLDLIMMVNNNGKERTFEEYKMLAEKAGFKKVELVHVNVSTRLAVMEFKKSI